MVQAVLAILVISNLLILVYSNYKINKSKEELINTLNILQDKINLLSIEVNDLRTFIKNLPKEITVKNVLKLP